MDILKVKKNAILNILGLVLPTIIFLIITPLMIDKLGAEGFGVIVIIQIITGYMNILNFGFSEAIIKQLAENVGRDADHVMRIMWVGLMLFSVVGLIGAVLIFFSSSWLGFDMLQIPSDLREDTVSGIQVGALIFFLQMIAEFYRGSSLGCGRFDVPNISRIIRVSISAVLIVYVLETGGGIYEVMLATLGGLVLGLIFNVIWMQKVQPLHYVSGNFKDITHELFHFSKHIFLTRLCGTFVNRVPHFFLGILTPIGNVTFYEVPIRVADAGSSILNRILQVFYPGFSSMDEETKSERIQDILYSVISIQIFLLMPLSLLAILEGNSLLRFWIDDEFSRGSSQVIIFIVIAYFLKSMTNLPFYCAMSMNKPEIISKYSLIQFFITLLILYPLISAMGLIGAAWVLLIPTLVNIPFIYELFIKMFGVNIYRKLAKPLLLHAGISIFMYSVYETIYRQSDLYTPVGVIFFGFVYWGLAVYLRILSKKDSGRLIRLVTAWR